jgi:hypothetical protein
LKRAFLGFGNSPQHLSGVNIGSIGSLILPFMNIDTNGNSMTLYRNGTPLVQGTDWWPGLGLISNVLYHNEVITFSPAFTAANDDIFTYDVQTQMAWVDTGPLTTNPVAGNTIGGSCMQFLGAALGTNSLPALGVRIIANQVSDNYMDGIGFEGLNHGLISHNYCLRNVGAGIIDLMPGCSGTGHFVYQQGSSINMAILDNYAAGNAGGDLIVPTTDGTIDNPEINAGTITRGGATQNFGNEVNNEVPTGLINGVNTTYTTLHAPIPGSLIAFKDGLRTTAFTLVGTSLTFSVAPTTSVIIDYSY